MFAIIRAKTISEALPQIKALEATKLIQNVITVVSSDDLSPFDKGEIKKCFVDVIVQHEFGWSKSLNAALKVVSSSQSNGEYILVVSTTVGVKADDVQSMVNAAQENNGSCGFALFKERTELNYLLPRNTYIVWEKSVLESMGPFDETLDATTGMEDYDMVLRAYRNLQKLPYVGPLSVDLKVPGPEILKRKLDRELTGIQLIEKRYDHDIVESLQNHLSRQAAGRRQS